MAHKSVAAGVRVSGVHGLHKAHARVDGLDACEGVSVVLCEWFGATVQYLSDGR